MKPRDTIPLPPIKHLLAMVNWSSKPKTKVSSTMFAGLNAIAKALKSNFGKAKATVESILGKEEMTNYTMPKVIMIGDESTGKSSVLENLIKCPVLPRASKMCTKCPICIKLDSGANRYSVEFKGGITAIGNKNMIAKTVSDYMASIPDGTIVSDEIIVRITEPNLASFEYYDLPGIRSYPESLCAATEALCAKYLAMDCIVLCVIPATNTRLTASRSLGLVKKHNKCPWTIISLTMVDQIKDNPEDLLVKRVLRTTDEFKELNVFGCVGVINRSCSNTESLEDSDNAETKWLNDTFGKSELPPKYEKMANKIAENLGSNNLVHQLDTLYNKYITENWKPKLIAQLEAKIASIAEEGRIIGDDLPRGMIVMAALDCVEKATTSGTMFMRREFNYAMFSDNKHCPFSQSVGTTLKVRTKFKLFIESLVVDANSISIVPKDLTLYGIHVNFNRFTEMHAFVQRFLTQYALHLIREFTANIENHIEQCKNKSLYTNFNKNPICEIPISTFMEHLNNKVFIEIYEPFEMFIVNVQSRISTGRFCRTGIKIITTFSLASEAFVNLCDIFNKEPGVVAEFDNNWVKDRAEYITKHGTPGMKKFNFYRMLLTDSNLYKESEATLKLRESVNNRLERAKVSLQSTIDNL